MTPYSAPGILPAPQPSEASDPLEDLLELCCRAFGQRKEDVVSKSRKAPLPDVRIAFCFIAYDLPGTPSPTKIGSYINVNHASAIYFRGQGLNRLGNPTFPVWNRKVRQLKREILLEL